MRSFKTNVQSNFSQPFTFNLSVQGYKLHMNYISYNQHKARFRFFFPSSLTVYYLIGYLILLHLFLFLMYLEFFLLSYLILSAVIILFFSLS